MFNKMNGGAKVIVALNCPGFMMQDAVEMENFLAVGVLGTHNHRQVTADILPQKRNPSCMPAPATTPDSGAARKG